MASLIHTALAHGMPALDPARARGGPLRAELYPESACLRHGRSERNEVGLRCVE